MTNKTSKEKALSVSDFIERINAVLLSQTARVQGEITKINKSYPTAIFFSIKDKDQEALLDCIIWQSVYKANGLDLKEGDEIIVTGTPSIFPRNGNFSLKTRTIEYAGEGALKKEYDKLKKKLLEEGLFDPKRKREIPRYPNKIGVITSKSGVVLNDFSSNLGNYGFKVKVIDSRVEGKDAIHELLSSIKTFEKEDIEVLVIMRGGGAWESLQPFNTESVVRAVANFKHPVITGIGHDVDVTLTELVADVGRSTPTAVVEILNKPWSNLIKYLYFSRDKIFRIFRDNLSGIHADLNKNSSKIKSVFFDLEVRINKAYIDFQNIISSMKTIIKNKKKEITDSYMEIKDIFNKNVENLDQFVLESFERVNVVFDNTITRSNEVVIEIEKNIKRVDPNKNLRLGYSLSYVGNKLIKSKKDIKAGNKIETKVSDGKFTSEVKDVK